MEPREDIASSLAAQARRAYEWGRARRAARGLVPVVLIGAVAAVGGDPTMVVLLGVPLAVLCFLCVYVGRGIERAVRPGLQAGLVPLAVALGTLQRFGCASDSCAQWCMPLCAAAGALLGAWLGTVMQAKERFGVVAASLMIAVLTASLGCAAIGLGTLLGAVLGLFVGLVPTFAYRTATHQSRT